MADFNNNKIKIQSYLEMKLIKHYSKIKLIWVVHFENVVVLRGQNQGHKIQLKHYLFLGENCFCVL